MTNKHIIVEQSLALKGTAHLTGAKNAVLVIMASLILTSGKSVLTNVPVSDDVIQMIKLLSDLGAHVFFNQESGTLEIDTAQIKHYAVSYKIMKKMRASILVMGPLLARFGKANVAVPGGCALGARPIDFHLKAFARMGVIVEHNQDYLNAHTAFLKSGTLILEYPSVGATENIIMAAALTSGVTTIVNAALEPEVLDLIAVLKKMGACIDIVPPATIKIEGVTTLKPIEYEIMFDRLEAGSLILAAAITGSHINLPQAPANVMQVFLSKLEEMGHIVNVGSNGIGIDFKATSNPQAISFKTMPYPGFPTDLQAPMMAALCLASGTSVIQETVFENRLIHVRELQKMGAQITVHGDTAIIKGVEQLYGASVIASDIRAACALVIAGLAAQGRTTISGVNHLQRGYQDILKKISNLGGKAFLSQE